MKILICLAFFIGSVSVSVGQISGAKNHVIDSAGILSKSQIDSLNIEANHLQNTIGSQLVILTIETLKGQPIERYSLKFANKIGIGRKGYDDGVLITVSHLDKIIRIEVGLGLELIIKDEIAARIIREKVGPEFQKGRYFTGLYNAVTEIKSLIEINKDLVGKRQ